MLDWIGALAIASLIDVVHYVLIGVLVSLSLGRSETARGAIARGVFALVMVLGLAALVRGVDMGRFPTAANLVLFSIGGLLGTWIGWMWLRGFQARLWLVLQLSLLLLMLAGGGGWLINSATENDPLPFKPAQVSSAEKRRLVHLLRSSHAIDRDGVTMRRLRFTEHDVDLFLAWILSLGSTQRKAEAHLEENQVTALVSAEVPVRGSGVRYVNVRAAGQFGITAGRPRLRIEQLRVGHVNLPRYVVDFLSSTIEAAIRDDPNVQDVLTSLQSVQILPGAVDVVYERGDFDKRVLPSLLARLGVKPDVLSATKAHIRHLVSVAEQLPQGDARFGAFLQAAFALSRERSRAGHPALENRAAIFALAILLGHRHVESLVGPITDRKLRQSARLCVGRVRVRGRGDWTKHFFVSAALALLSDDSLSNAVGLLKEELDAGKGGSGFSFSDVLADRAGTRFALAATRNDRAARAIQERLTGDFHIDDVFPPAADLPEGIPAREFESRYGGVGGAGYRRIMREINRRLAGCASLR